MKIILDANVFISAAYRGGNPARIIDRVESFSDTLFITDEIIAEVEDVFGRPKFNMSKETQQREITHIKRISTKITVTDSERITTGGSIDKTDNKYLECAAAANADYIITGDKHLLVLKEYKGVKIVKPAEYLDFVNGAAG